MFLRAFVVGELVVFRGGEGIRGGDEGVQEEGMVEGG